MGTALAAGSAVDDAHRPGGTTPPWGATQGYRLLQEKGRMAHAQAKAQRMKTTVAKSNGQSLFEHTLAVARYAASLCTDRRRRRILIQAAGYHDMCMLVRGL